MLPAIATPERDMVKTPPSKAVRLRGKAVTHTELHKAVLRDNVDLVRRVLLRGAGPWGHANARDWWGRTPLHRACERGNVSILVELMTRGGADPNIQENQWLRAPLHIASERNLLEVAAVLLAHGSDPNQADRQHSTPLMLATCEGHTDMCELLLKAGANASSRNNEGLTPLHVACRDGQRDIVCLLCDVRARPNNVADVDATAVSKDGITSPLHLACEGGYTNIVSELLAQSADVNVRDHRGWAPLHVTAWHARIGAARELLAHPTCNLKIQNKQQENPYELIKRRKRSLKKQRNGNNTKHNARDDGDYKRVRRALAFFRTAYTDLDAAVRQAVSVEDGGDGQVRMKIVGVAEGRRMLADKAAIEANAARFAASMNAGKNALAKIEASRDISMVGKVNGDEEGNRPRPIENTRSKIDGQGRPTEWDRALFSISNQLQSAVGRLLSEQRWAKSAGLEEIIGLVQKAGNVCNAAKRTMRATMRTMDAWEQERARMRNNRPEETDLFSQFSLDTDEDLTKRQISVAEKKWRSDKQLYEAASELLANDFTFGQKNGESAAVKRSTRWQAGFRVIWERLRDTHGWSVRSARIRERIEPGSVVQVRRSAISTDYLNKQSLLNPIATEHKSKQEDMDEREYVENQTIGMPLQAVVKYRFKDGTYEVQFTTGDCQRMLRQDIVEMTNKSKADGESSSDDDTESESGQNKREKDKIRVLNMYEAVCVKRSGWDRWYDAEVIRLYKEKDSGTGKTEFKYDLKMTVMGSIEKNVSRRSIRKGPAAGKLATPFYYFKLGAVRQSDKTTLNVDYFESEEALVQHIASHSEFAGVRAAIKNVQLCRKIVELEEQLESKIQQISNVEHTRQEYLGLELLRPVFKRALERKKLATASRLRFDLINNKSISLQNQSEHEDLFGSKNEGQHKLKADADGVNLCISRAQLMRTLAMDATSRRLFAVAIKHMHPGFGKRLLNPKFCATLLKALDESRNGMISLQDIVTYCGRLSDKSMRYVLSIWTLENIFIALGHGKWHRSNTSNSTKSLRIPKTRWLEIVAISGVVPGQKQIDHERYEAHAYATAVRRLNDALEENIEMAPMDEEILTKANNVALKELHEEHIRKMKVAKKKNEDIANSALVDTLRLPELHRGIRLLREPHRYKSHRLFMPSFEDDSVGDPKRRAISTDSLYSSSRDDSDTISPEELYTIAEDLVLEEESNAAALESLTLLFDVLDPNRLNYEGADGRISEPKLYKALTLDSQSRSLLAKAATHAAHCRSGYERVVDLGRMEYVDQLVNNLLRERDRREALDEAKKLHQKRTSKKNSSALSSNGYPPRSGYIGPEEFFVILKDVDAVRRDRIKSTLMLAGKQVRQLLLEKEGGQLKQLELLNMEDWEWSAATSPHFRSIMRNGGLARTLTHLLKGEQSDAISDTGCQSGYSSMAPVSSAFAKLIDISIELGEPRPPMSEAQKAVSKIWKAIHLAENAGLVKHVNSKQSYQSIPIKQETWIKYFVSPETRLKLSSVGEEEESQCGDMAPELRGCLEALPMGLQLARRAPTAHIEALTSFTTEIDGYLFPDELLAFGETQSSGPGLVLLKKELEDNEKVIHTHQMAFVRQLFDAIDPACSEKAAATYRKNKKRNANMLAVGEGANRKIAKSNLLRAISYRNDVRALLRHAHAPPGLVLALTEPRKFRRLLNRAIDTRNETSKPIISSPAKGSSLISSPPKSKTEKKTAVLISQQDLLAIAKRIERDEIEAPKRALKRYIGDVFRQVFDLVADDAALIGVSTHDLALALRHKQEVIDLLEGRRRAVSSDTSLVNSEALVHPLNLPSSVKSLPQQWQDIEEWAWMEREGVVTVQELLRFCGILEM